MPSLAIHCKNLGNILSEIGSHDLLCIFKILVLLKERIVEVAASVEEERPFRGQRI